jgi:hypothetical protein
LILDFRSNGPLGPLTLSVTLALVLCSAGGALAADPPGASGHQYIAWVKSLPLDQLAWPFESRGQALSATNVADAFAALRLDGATIEDLAPQRYYIKYDAANHLVAFQRGCCSWAERALEEASSSPPAGLATADYGGVKTDLEIGIGSTSEDVVKAFGPVKAWVASKTSALRGVEYRHRIGPAHPTCVQDARFAFDSDRVVAMSFITAC